MNEKPIIKTKEKLGFMAFSTSLNIVYNFKSLYYMIFLTNILKIDPLTAGTMTAIGVVWDAINDPLIGIWSANHTFKNGEKVRPYALYCCIPWAITIVLLFTDFHTSESLKVILGLLVFFVFEIFNTFLSMPYNSMGALASQNDADRKAINAFRSLGGCLGSGIGSVAVPLIVKLFGGLKEKVIGPQDAKPLLYTSIVMGIICIIGSLIHYYTTKERVKPISENEEKINLIQGYKMLFKCKSWILNMCYIITYGISNALIMTCINYYASYVLGSTAASTPILAAYLVIAIITSLLTPIIDKKIGRKKTTIMAAIVLIVGKIPFIINPYSMLTIYINAITVGFGSTVTFVLFNTNRNNISDIVAWKNNRRIDSLVSSGDNLVSKGAEAIAHQLIGVGLAVAGFNADLLLNQPQSALDAICKMLGLIPFIIACVMLVITFIMDIQKEYNETKPQE